MTPGKAFRVLECALFLVTAGAVTGFAEAIVTAPTATSGCGCAEDAGPHLPPSLIPSKASSLLTGTELKPEEKKTDVVEPLFLRPLVAIEAGRNDSNPVWSPQGTFIAYERSVGDKKEVRITLPDGTPVQTVYHVLSGGGSEMKFFFPGVSQETSYNAGITWSPDEYRFVFMSNGGEGNYDLYLQELGATGAARLTEHKEKDGQAHWSRAGDRIVFVSGRTGNGDVYVMDLVTRALTRLTGGGAACLYPQWSPDGGKVVMMRGSNENHDIVLITDVAKPVESLKALTTWPADDIRPVWSPDGKKIAFYSNYNTAGDPRIWSLVVVSADGSDPSAGDGLAAKAVALHVIPDVEAGPAWMPDSNRIVYVKNDRQEYNPLYVVDVRDRSGFLIRTDTKMNHDVASGPDGTIAFRAQVNQWDQIFIAKLKE